MEQIIYLKTGDLRPYRNNPRKNAGAVDAVAASIKEYGFRNPIIIDENNTVINGHTRLLAAKKLKLDEVPCVRVTDLTEEQIKQYRLIDNKTGEIASWDSSLLEQELFGMDFTGLDFEFDFTKDLKKQNKWEESKKRCDLKDHVAIRKSNGAYFQSLFRSSKEGKLLTELKTEENVYLFADTALQFIQSALGSLKGGDWCIVTTPRRRHGDGFHFATAICKTLSINLGIPFYPDTFICYSKQRICPVFEMKKTPNEKNILLYDDILTTGSTFKASRDLLISAGYNVFALISIDNN